MTEPEPSAAASIAIVGLAGRFPGANDAAAFWENLVAGRNSITQLTDEQLAAAGYEPARVRALPGYVAARGLLDRPEWFDREFFDVSHREAEVIDPQHRVFLEIAWEALEDAACDPSRHAGLIGVFASVSNNSYFPAFVARRPDLLASLGRVRTVLGNEKDFPATRLAYKLNLRGPALNIQTACSSSLVTVCVACQSLLHHQCDVALAGGASITFPQERGYFAQEGAMTSPDGTCRPFDARANGTVFSSGAGVVVLKRLEDALADHDHIYAVIRGAAVNNDGAQKVGFAAPSVQGQAEVIALAQAIAGVTPESISYVEAHGTATALGDPVEIEGLTQVFRAATGARHFCGLGSVKGNIGHCDATSGISSLIKMALAFDREQLPASLGCETPNPALHLDDSPFYLQTALQPWPRGRAPRFAGVSSFGVGGTNAHLVLGDAPAAPAPAPGRTPQVLVLSARTATALDRRARDLADLLERKADVSLADVAHTLQVGRQRFAHRRACVATTAAEAIAALRQPTRLQRLDTRQDAPVAFLFPGQGAQYAGMGAALHRSEPAFRDALDEVASVLQPELGVDLRELIFSTAPDAAERLRETRFTQPAIFALDYALGRLWLALGVQPAALLGHSVGEFAAAALAGIFSTADAARLVATRARLVHALPGGAMLALRATEAQARELLGGTLDIAAVNAPNLCVIAGPFEEIARVETACEERNIAARRLATSHAFHSPMVDAVVAPFAEAVAAAKPQPPALPIVSSVTGQWLTDAQATDPQYWARHLRATVRFADAVGQLLDDRALTLLEAGPGQTLTQLARQHPQRTDRHELAHTIAEAADEIRSLQTAVAHLWLAGATLEWPLLRRGEKPRRLSLPTYPFERQRYFADLPRGVHPPLTTAGTDGEPPLDESDAFATAAAPSASSALSAQAPESPSPAEAAPPVSMLDAIRATITELSGQDISTAPGDTGFLELGFDSLFLSQAAITLTRKFGVTVRFRQLLREQSTLQALADFLEGSGAKVAAPAATPAAPAPAARPAPKPAAPAAHGPFRPLNRELSGELTEAQTRWLHDFIGRYTARTARSKAHTERYRPVLADPRAVAGFKQVWKEMVYPIVVERSAGAKLWDIDGNEWTDITLAFGAAMLGHQPPFAVAAMKRQMDIGMEIGPTSPLAGEVAQMLCERTGMERVTFCNTGSEAVTGAVRVARTVTGRPLIVYFSGSYHGIDNEALGFAAGAHSTPIAPGITREALANALILEYGDPRSLEAIAARAGDIAAVLVEPVQSRRPGFQPREFLHELRALTREHDIALIFDEVVTGFRCHPGGAQAHFGIKADLATYGKIIGGGISVGVIAGSAHYMDAFDGGAWRFGDDSFPEAAVTFFAGTFVRHPLALAAVKSVLEHLAAHGPALQENLARRTDALVARVAAIFDGTPFSVTNFTSNWSIHIAPEFRFGSLLYALLRHRGFHVWEARPWFVSTEHSDADLDRLVEAIRESVRELEEAGFFTREKRGDAPPGADVIPTTESQRELLLVCQHDPIGSSAYNETWTLRLQGGLDLAAFRSAVQSVIDRHDALRATFTPSGEWMVITPRLTVDVPLIDLSALPAAEREARLDAMREAESTRVFDLQHGPLVVLQMVKLAESEYALVFCAHHVMSDGWSCDVMISELAKIYSARVAGKPHGLPAAMQMREYEKWETAMRTSAEFTEDERYWLERFRTLPPELTLPGDRPHPRRRSYRGTYELIQFPPELVAAASRLGSERGATFFAVLLAACHTLLHRLTGETDHVLGVPSAGQNLVEGAHLIGHCVNLLPLRTQFSADATFAELLAAVQTTVLEGFEHRRMTFGTLLQKLTMARPPGRIPLVPITFNLDPPLSHVQFAGMTHVFEHNPRAAFQFDLGFNLDTNVPGVRVMLKYNADILDGPTVHRWIELYREILATAVAEPQRKVREFLPALRAAEPAAASAPLEKVTPGEPPAARVMCWVASPSAGGELFYDDVLYNVMEHDKARHDLYRRAFAQTVKGKVVADLGTGRDALLARFCIEAGASRVYAIEVLEKPAQQARALVEKLGLSDRIIVIHGRSQDVQLPELVDLCVSENIGHIAGAEGGDLMLIDARRLLKPGGRMVPERSRTHIAAVAMPDDFMAAPRFEPLGAHYAQQSWNSAGYKYDLRVGVMNTDRRFLLSEAAIFEEIDFNAAPVAEYEREVRLRVTRGGRLDGFLCWIEVEAVPGVSLESIDAQESWLPVFLPAFADGVRVAPGDVIQATASGRLAENGVNRDYRVRGCVERQDGTRVPFDYDSPHYRQCYRHVPFYDRLFAGDTPRVAAPPAGNIDPANAAPAALNPADRQRVLVEWNGATRPFPADRGIHRLFEEQAARRPDGVAIADGSTRLTYGELNARANRLARRLRDMGISRGICAGVCAEHSPEFLIAVLAVLKAGGAYVPIDVDYPAGRIAGMVSVTRAPLVLARAKASAALAACGARVLSLEGLDLSRGDGTDFGEPGSGEDLAYVMFTSGSTGTPKAVAVPHRAISRLVIDTDYAPLTADDVVAFSSNVCFDATTFEIWGALLNGGTCAVTRHEVLLSPEALRAHYAAQGVTAAFLTTSLFNRHAQEAPDLFRHLRYLLVGGEAMDPASIRRVLAAGRPQHLANIYGPTETTTFALFHEIARAEGERIPLGRPIANTTAYLLDEQQQPVAVGATGEIYIGGPGLALGYLHQPEFTAERFVQTGFGRLYRTGDLARWTPDGRIDFLGRADDQVKMRGFRIEPGEIEAALRTHPAVAEARVIARQHATAGKQLAAYVTARRGQTASPAELRAHLENRLPEYMVPSGIAVLDRLPLTPNGKLDTRALPEPGAVTASQTPHIPPRNPVESNLSKLWHEVLGRNSFSVHDDFFLVGGHSLLAIRLLSRIREQMRVEVPVSRLFETPTIAGLGEYVAERLPVVTTGSSESLVMIQKGEPQRSPLFLVPGGWGGEIEFLVYAELVRHLDRNLPLYGLRARASNADPLPQKSVEEFAAGFVQNIRAFQPRGPYMIGGECVGGVIAYEIARQLEAAGERVSLLLLLDTEWPSEKVLAEFEEWEAQRLRQEQDKHRRTLGGHLAELRQRSPLDMLRYAWRHLRPRAMERLTAGFVAERERNAAWPRRLMGHQLQPHAGRVTLLLDEASSRTGMRAEWEARHRGALDVHIVAGDHTSYIREHAPEAAATLRRLIEEATQTVSC